MRRVYVMSERCCCCCWQPLRLPPCGVVRFLCCHVLKLEFWHFVHMQLNSAFAFASVFAVFYSKKSAPAGGLHCFCFLFLVFTLFWSFWCSTLVGRGTAIVFMTK